MVCGRKMNPIERRLWAAAAWFTHASACSLPIADFPSGDTGSVVVDSGTFPDAGVSADVTIPPDASAPPDAEEPADLGGGEDASEGDRGRPWSAQIASSGADNINDLLIDT